MSRAFCCEVCNSDEPRWRLDRHGDAAVSWACAAHLSEVCERLQRDGEVTEISIRLTSKLREWARKITQPTATKEGAQP